MSAIFLLLAAFVLTVTWPAHADPLSIATISATWFNVGITWAAAQAISFGIQAALVVGLSFASYALNAKAGGQGQTRANAPEVRYSTRQSAPPKRKIYGKAHVGGALFFERVSAPFLVQGWLINEGEIESVDEIYIGTNRLSFPGGIVPDTILTPSNVSGQPNYAGHIRCCVRLGTDAQARDALLFNRFGGTIVPTEFRQRGIATVVMEYRHPGNDFEDFQELYGNNRYPNAFFVARGLKVYDPRDPSQDPDDRSTWKFSNNASLVQTDYMRADYGGRIQTSRVNWDKVKEAADYDDSPMATQEGINIKKYTANGLFSLNQPPADVMGDLLSANRGSFVQEGGFVWPESSRPKSRVLTITDDLLTGGIQFQPFKNRRELVNIVEPRFIAEEGHYETVPGPEWRDTDLITAHGEQHRASLSLPFTLDHRRAQRLTKLFGLDAQLEKSIALQVDLKVLAMATGPLTGGVVTVESQLFPQANGDYEVKTLGFVDGFAAIEMACVEYDETIETDWDPSVDQKAFTALPS